jgi:hypothetical protein
MAARTIWAGALKNLPASSAPSTTNTISGADKDFILQAEN